MIINFPFFIIACQIPGYIQGSKVIRQWPTKIMYISNVNTQIYPLCRVHLVVDTKDTQLNKPTNQDSLKVPKVVKATNKKTLL